MSRKRSTSEDCRRNERTPTQGVRCPLGSIVDLSAAGLRAHCTGKPSVLIGHTLSIHVEAGDRRADVSGKVIWIARMQALAPFFAPNKAKVGATIDGTDGALGATYAYPVLTAMADQDVDLVYAMTKAMVDLFDQYKGKAPGINGWALDKQNFEWVSPYHEGAIKYFMEIGVWNDAAQAHNDKLVARQGALAEAWRELEASNPSDWESAWDAKRREALENGGFEVVF
eukprot:TRINITY_DN92380_c0_g1_i1.p2 TRINITY_DN92380_c0_g1~~TRINITY_DN92380_c0_g1_i1.p2  ORF type:complete len:227 (+),score=19.34 TRINITY_DN92380_c0_g1_i1:3-683(+)